MSTFWNLYASKRLMILLSFVTFMRMSFLSYNETECNLTNTEDSVLCLHHQKHNDLRRPLNVSSKSDTATILYWTRFFKRDPWKEYLSTVNQLACLKGCKYTTNRNHVIDSDVVLFHAFDMSLKDMPKIPPNVRSRQVWVYMNQESPSTHPRSDLSKFNKYFNWTMTYRRDSDIHHHYGQIIKREGGTKSYKPLKPEDVERKTKLVFWMVSNCKTNGKRELLVAELRKFIPIDIFGGCGNYSCSRKDQGCFPRLTQEYKFYLSFENSLCVDYVTEKLYNALKYDVVPIVYGGADYNLFAPLNSVINANNFTSAKSLASYLIYLHKNPAEYLKYFEWKQMNAVKNESVNGDDQWCNLCRKVLQLKRSPSRKIYKNLSSWWTYVRLNNTYNTYSKNSSTGHAGTGGTEEHFIPACNNKFSFSNEKYLWNSNVSKKLTENQIYYHFF